MNRRNAILWGAVALTGLALAELGIFHLVQEGTCASGGPYEIRNPCPGSTWLWLSAVAVGGLIFFVGVALLATEFSAKAGDRPSTLIFSSAWVLSGLVALAAVYSPGAREGSRTGGVIICIVWIALGVVPNLLGLRSAAKRRVQN